MKEGFDNKKKPKFESGLRKPEDDASLQPQQSINEIIDAAIKNKRDKFYRGHSQEEIDRANELKKRMTGEKDD